MSINGPVAVGDRVETWFSGNQDGKSTVLAVSPYAGCYPQWFVNVIRVTAPNTRRGWIEILENNHG